MSIAQSVENSSVAQVLRVMLVDEQQLVRDALRLMLAGQNSYAVVAEAADARSALELAEKAHPELIVTELTLPDTDGLSLSRELRRRLPDCRLLVLSGTSSAALVNGAVAAGADGYALKTQPASEVLAAIAQVATGERYLAPAAAALLAEPDGGVPTDGDGDPLALLTVREREIFFLLLRGLANRRIAGELTISIRTVETHRARILKKLAVHSMADLVRFGARNGLLATP
jgi:DNA-binding NarL/FixJ family response regulator